MIGGESESDGEDRNKAGRASFEEAGAIRRALAQQGHQQAAAAGSMPAAHLSSLQLHASSEAAAGRVKRQEPAGVSGRHQLHATTPHTADLPVGGSARRSLRDEEMEPTQPGHEGKSRAEGHLGRKQKRGKKAKPQSQLQLMQAQVQAQKASRTYLCPP